MTAFSPTDAAFEGFRLTRERPGAVLIWAGAYVVFSLAMAVAAVSFVGPELAQFQALQQSPDAAATLVLLNKLTPFYAIVIPSLIVFFAILTCAIYRAILRPEDRGFGYLRLGADEFRMMQLEVIYFLLWLAAVFFVTLAVGLVVATLGAIAGPAAGLLSVLARAAALAVSLWIFVRLSLAGPMTFAERRLFVFKSWPVTGRAFWPLCGAYLLAFALGAVIFVLMAVIYYAIVAVAVRATGGEIAGTNISSLRALLTIPALVSEVLNAAMMSIFYVVILSPSAIAYRQLAAVKPNQVAATFD
jgi:hypothetical protein